MQPQFNSLKCIKSARRVFSQAGAFRARWHGFLRKSKATSRHLFHGFEFLIISASLKSGHQIQQFQWPLPTPPTLFTIHSLPTSQYPQTSMARTKCSGKAKPRRDTCNCCVCDTKHNTRDSARMPSRSHCDCSDSKALRIASPNCEITASQIERRAG